MGDNRHRAPNLSHASFLTESRARPRQRSMSRSAQPVYPITFDDLAASGAGNRFPEDNRYPASYDFPQSAYGDDMDEDGAEWFRSALSGYGDGRTGEAADAEADVPAAIADWLLRADLGDRLRKDATSPNKDKYKAPRKEPRRALQRSKRTAEKKNSEEKPGKAERINAVLRAEKMKHLFSSNMLAVPTLSSNKGNTSTSEIDIVFSTSWTLPSPIDNCVLQRLRRKLSVTPDKTKSEAAKLLLENATDRCVQQLSQSGYHQPMKRRRKRSDGGISLVKENDDDERIRTKRASARRRLDDQLPSKAAVRFRNPFTIGMGELQVHRLRLRCSCSNNFGRNECPHFKPLNEHDP